MKYRRETAVVEKVEDGGYILRLVAPSEEECTRCGLCKASEQDIQVRFLRIKTSGMKGRPSAGESVEVYVPGLGGALAALIVFGIPLAGGIAALAAGVLLHLADWTAVVLGGAGFAIGWTVSYIVWGRHARPYAEAED